MDLNISGGNGQYRENPIIIMDEDPDVSSLTEMRVLRGIGIARGILWKILNRQIIKTVGSTILQTKIETIEVTKDEVITQTENYYFDVTSSGRTNLQIPSVPLDLNRFEKFLPYEFGYLHYDSYIDIESRSPGLGVTFAYGSLGIKGAIYLYDNGYGKLEGDRAANLLIEEFERGQSDIRTHNPNLEPLGKTGRSKSFFMRRYRLNNEFLILCLGIYRGMFFKLRMTHVEDPIVLDSVVISLQSIEQFVEN